MPLISKPNYNQIFASQAPDIDKPAVFNNYPGGWGMESRPNNGKPTVKGFNYLQQTSDLKDLWILQNGACLPYDESIEYAEGAPVLKDGVIQYKTADGFKSRDSVTVPTYNNAADGVDPVTGVSNGAYFNVRSSSDESYIDEYQNIGGVPTPSGKSYPSSNAKWDASLVVDGNENQHQINDKLRTFDVTKYKLSTDPDDHLSFKRCVAALKANNGGRFLVPAGDYIVGNQVAGYDGFRLGGEHIMYFDAIPNLTIDFQSPTIKFKDGMYWGSFDDNMQPINKINTDPDFGAQWGCSYGHMLRIRGCGNVSINGTATFDGNIDQCVLGGQWGDNGIQLWHHGIVTEKNSIVSDKSVINVTNFGGDGAYLGWNGFDPKTTIQAGVLTLENYDMDGNSRQGVSITGGGNIAIKNSRLRNTGKLFAGYNPMAGFDVEAESGYVDCMAIENCEISNNSGFGYIDFPQKSGNLTVKHSRIYGGTQYAVNTKKTKFEHCSIYGAVLISDPLDANDSSKKYPIFRGCTITQDHTYSEVVNRPILVGTYTGGGIGSGHYAEFHDCIFEIKNGYFNTTASNNRLPFKYVRCKFVIVEDATPLADGNGIFAFMNNDDMIECEWIDKRPAGSVLRKIQTSHNSASRNVKITAPHGTLKFHFGGGIIYTPVVAPLSNTVSSIKFTKNLVPSISAETDTTTISYHGGLPSSSMISGSSDPVFYGRGSFIMNSLASANSEWGYQCYNEGYISNTVWTSGATVGAGVITYSGSNVYYIATGGTYSTTAPTHTSGTVSNGTTQLRYLGQRATFRIVGRVGTAVANSTDTTNVAIQLNSLLASLRAVGLIAT